MEQLNSTASRSMNPQENMRALEKAINVADQRIRMRRQAVANGQITMSLLFLIPFGSYMIYNFFAPGGVMQNYKASSGAYMAYPKTWMLKQRSMTNIWRPEIEFTSQAGALHAYTRKIEAQKAAGTAPEGVYQPTSWL